MSENEHHPPARKFQTSAWGWEAGAEPAALYSGLRINLGLVALSTSCLRLTGQLAPASVQIPLHWPRVASHLPRNTASPAANAKESSMAPIGLIGTFRSPPSGLSIVPT